MDILLLIALILLNGVLAMSEIALVTARKSRLQRLAEDGDKSAATAIRLGEEPTQFLSTVQIGITAIGLLNGIVGEAALAGPLAVILQNTGLSAGTSAICATALVVTGITYISIVIGELVPKRIAQINADNIARIMALPIAIMAKLSRPFVHLLAASTDGILRLMGKLELNDSPLTEEDIHDVLMEGSQTGIIEKQEHEIVRNVFRLDDRQAASLMTPRNEIVYLDLDQPLDASLQKLIASNHSRLPVCHGAIDNLQGVITAKQLLAQHLENKSFAISECLAEPVFVPKSLSGMKLLEQFRQSDVHMVFVVDEYGGILGLVTLQDVLEALAGEFITPLHPDDVWAMQREDGSWLLDGLIPIPELKDRLSLKTVPEEEKGRYHTLSGMLMWLIGTVPGIGDVTDWEGWRFEVVDLDGNRIDKVLAIRLSSANPTDPYQAAASE